MSDSDMFAVDPSVQANTTAQRIERALKFLIAATLVLYLAMAGIGYYIYNIGQNANEGLCALRADVQLRVESSQQFLIDNPKGTSAIPKSVLLTSIQNSKRTVKALKGVECPSPPG